MVARATSWGTIDEKDISGEGTYAGGPTAGTSPEPDRLGVGTALVPLVLEGFVLLPDGAPAEGVVVISSAGGKAVTDARGFYRLEVNLQTDVERLEITAVGQAGRNLTASTNVVIAGVSGTSQVAQLTLAVGATCAPSWLPTFGKSQQFLDGRALVAYDDGGGSALYRGGVIAPLDGDAGVGGASYIAKWDGTSWSALGSGVDNDVYALAVFDDGSGAAIYAGGEFTTAGGVPASRIAKWDGTTWSALGSGIGAPGRVSALTVYDDGSGAALYAGGSFTTLGGVAANRIAKWDGTSWSALGSGLSTVGSRGVQALTVYDDGSGPALYAGGQFTTAGGVPASLIAKWNGTSWSALGSGISGFWVNALAVYDDGSGAALFVGGKALISAGGAPVSNLKKWDGTTWSELSSSVGGDVWSFAVHDDGSGIALYAGVGVPYKVAKWDGASWSTLGSGMDNVVFALAVYDDGSGAAVCATGFFDTAGSAWAPVAKWNGMNWSRLDTSTGIISVNGIDALAVYDDGAGAALYAGDLRAVGELPVRGIGKWDGANWSTLGSGVDGGIVHSLAVHDDGGGARLYAGGNFTTAGGVPASNIAKWDGASWSPLGSGIGGQVWVLATYDGGGTGLYAGGTFTTAGGGAANRIAKWNGTGWSALGSGTNDYVLAMAVYDDGSGAALYAGGTFTTAGGVAANKIAKWNGSSWSALGSGIGAGGVVCLAVYNDGSGAALYAGGLFTTAGGLPASNIAKWNGSSWLPLGSGIGGGQVLALATYDDGGGPALYAGGDFTTAGGGAASRIAKWKGSFWSTLGSGMNNPVYCLANYDYGAGTALYAGGFFSAIDSGDSNLAKWGCLDTTPPLVSCPSSMSVNDRLSDGIGEVVVFSVMATDDLDPSPLIMCVPSSGSTFPPGTTLVQCTATDASGNQGTCQFEITVRSKLRERKF